MKKICIIILSLFAFAGMGRTFAQIPLPNTEGVTIDSLQVDRRGDNLIISCNLIFGADFRLPSNKMIKLTPVLSHKDKSAECAPLIVSGRNRKIMMERNHTSYNGTISRTNRKEQRIPYCDTIPFEKWQMVADIYFIKDIYCCRNEVKMTGQLPVSSLNMLPERYQPQPEFPAVVAKETKRRDLSGRAYLSFPVNKTSIYPEYLNNKSELNKILETVKQVEDNKYASITAIRIKGYASPEGKYSNNERLAKERSEALAEYISKEYKLDKNLFKVEYEPEDWEGMRDMVSASDLEDKDALLEIITGDDAPDIKEGKLRQSKSFRYIRDKILPWLRHSDYRVDYIIADFDIGQSKEIIKTNPSLLSPQEMIILADSYEIGSAENKEVLEIAEKVYPNNELIRLRLGVVAMKEGDYDKAEAILKTVGSLPEAQYNLSEIRKMREIDEQYDF